jgi:hypothetical protein
MTHAPTRSVIVINNEDELKGRKKRRKRRQWRQH